MQATALLGVSLVVFAIPVAGQSTSVGGSSQTSSYGGLPAGPQEASDCDVPSGQKTMFFNPVTGRVSDEILKKPIFRPKEKDLRMAPTQQDVVRIMADALKGEVRRYLSDEVKKRLGLAAPGASTVTTDEQTLKTSNQVSFFAKPTANTTGWFDVPAIVPGAKAGVAWDVSRGDGSATATVTAETRWQPVEVAHPQFEPVPEQVRLQGTWSSNMPHATLDASGYFAWQRQQMSKSFEHSLGADCYTTIPISSGWKMRFGAYCERNALGITTTGFGLGFVHYDSPLIKLLRS
jgi:hypothetical protein